jgi:hypothetical protein
MGEIRCAEASGGGYGLWASALYNCLNRRAFNVPIDFFFFFLRRQCLGISSQLIPAQNMYGLFVQDSARDFYLTLDQISCYIRPFTNLGYN